MTRPFASLSLVSMLDIARALIEVRLLRRRRPLFVEWNLTFHCNLQCRYCGAAYAPQNELDTGGVLAGLDALRGLGTRWITFGGGEPLLRKDIVSIVRFAREKGFHVFLSTNGWLLPEKAEALEWVEHVNLSIDGGQAVHDAVRGAGAFTKTMEALRICRARRTDVSLVCVLSSENLDRLAECIEIAARNDTTILFQPATAWLNSSAEPNPVAPASDAYHQAVQSLIAMKKSGAPIRNSFPGLEHLGHWPVPTKLWCSAARLTLTIEPDGTLLACHQAQMPDFLAGKIPPGGPELKGAIPEQFSRAVAPASCRQCWCGPMVELALLFALRPRAILNALRLF